MGSRLARFLAVAFATLVVVGWFGGLAIAGFPYGGAAHRAALAAGSATDQWLNVSVSSALAFSLSANEVTPGATVHVAVTQLDDVLHTFTLSPLANYQLPTTDGPAELQTFFATHAPLVNVTIQPGAGHVYFANFTAPALGIYEYLCLEPSHFPSMAGLLGSGEAPGGLSSDTGPGAPVFIISGTIAGLVVVAIVLGFVVGRRRGSHDEMPPERLGYAEPSTPASPPKPRP